MSTSSAMRGRLRGAARRLAWGVLVIVGVTTLSFVVTQLLPGDPARMMLGPQASAADVAHVRELYGLEKPLHVSYPRYWARQYALYWGRLVHLGPPPIGDKRHKDHRSCASLALGVHVDLGFSFHYRKPVVDLLAAKIPRSIELALAALAVQLALGVGVGLAAAAKRGTAWEEAAVGATLLGVSAPTFLLGLVLQYVLAYKLRWLPYDGHGTTAADHLRSIVLPALTLGVFGSALYARIVRDEVGGLLEQGFVRTARAKGASGARVLVVHALRNALAPIATMAALDLGTLVGGAIVTEKLFRWPGVGQMTVEALLNRDAPVIFGTVLFTSSAVVASTVALDLVFAWIDPRGARE